MEVLIVDVVEKVRFLSFSGNVIAERIGTPQGLNTNKQINE